MADLHALLVGVDRHLPQRVAGGGLIPDLQGCVRDVERMEDFLRHGPLALPTDRIRKLVSPASHPGGPCRQAEALPTYRNLLRELEALAERGRSGDQVLVHYSGHGASLPTVAPEKKGRAGRDECLVPCDAAVPREDGGGFLRDVELHALLVRLAGRGLRVTLVLDCCHSGGVTRGEHRGRVRGLGHLPIPAGAPGPRGPWNALGSSLREGPEPPERTTFRNLEGASGWFPQPEGCVLLAACLSTEYAREYPFDGAWSGALTHFLLGAMGDLGPGATYQWLHHRLLGRIRGLFEQQTPVLEGDGEAVFLGRGRRPATGGAARPPGVLLRQGAQARPQEHLARYRAVEELTGSAGSPLAGRVRAELFALARKDDWSLAGSRVPLGACTVPTGTLLCLLVHNESDRELNVAVLDLQPDRGIRRVHPNRYEGAFTTIPAGCELPIFLRAYLPDGLDEGRDRLKVIAATGPLDVTHLELDALPVSARDSRLPDGADDTSPQNDTALGPPSRNLSNAEPPAVCLAPAAPRAPEWTVATVEVAVSRLSQSSVVLERAGPGDPRDKSESRDRGQDPQRRDRPSPRDELSGGRCDG